MDLNRLRQGEQIAAIAAIVLLLDMFIFKWFGLKASGPLGISVEGSKNAWGSFDVIDIILFITVLAALGMAYLRASDSDLDLPVAASVVVTVLGALGTLLILYRLISPPDFGAPDINGLDHTRKIGAFIGLIAAGALTYGGYLAMQERGDVVPGCRRSLRRRWSAAANLLAPPPPGGEPAPPPPSAGAPFGASAASSASALRRRTADRLTG